MTKFILIFICVFMSLFTIVGSILTLLYCILNSKVDKKCGRGFVFVTFVDRFGREIAIIDERHIRFIMLNYYKFDWIRFFKVFHMVMVKDDYSYFEK